MADGVLGVEGSEQQRATVVLGQCNVFCAPKKIHSRGRE